MFLTTDNKMKWRLLGAGAAVTAALVLAGVFWFDAPVLLMMRELDCRFWRILSAVFDDKVWAVAFVAAVLGFYIKKSLISKPKIRNDRNQLSVKAFVVDFWQKTRHSNVFLIFCSIFAAGLAVQVLKVVIGRARPILFEALEFTGFYPPSFDWVFNSMPSGHTAISFAALVMIGMLAPRIKPLTWTLAVFVGVARVCVGAHWPTDVIFGAFIGMVSADLVKWWLMRIK
ncbi:MAG: phosphatase PAP2 family protein [Alphaproteobacteria bacterium]|nr:phosphatase PAP2 family protein [Alphaproteobacteria bacterium]